VHGQITRGSYDPGLYRAANAAEVQDGGSLAGNDCIEDSSTMSVAGGVAGLDRFRSMNAAAATNNATETSVADRQLIIAPQRV
jgi:hypothetical protein